MRTHIQEQKTKRTTFSANNFKPKDEDFLKLLVSSSTFSTSPMIQGPCEPGSGELLVSARDPVLSQTDWLPISKRLISPLEDALYRHV